MLTRLSKEFRLQAVPAALVLAATVLPLAWDGGLGEVAAPTGWWITIAVMGFYSGTALLVALPLGTEFQQRTLTLLLSQPISRGRIWMEKGGALVAVLATLALAQYAAVRLGPLAGYAVGREVGFLAVLACSGMFWTLLAGSTIGGLAFNLAALLLLEMVSNVVVGQLSGTGLELFAGHPAIVAIRAAYALITVWLGWRMFARFEERGRGADLWMPSFGGAFASGWLRCRPTGIIGNLIRKELRLQQPTFLIAGLFAVCWVAAAAFFAIQPERTRAAEIVFTLLLASYLPLALVVAGTISMAEDTSLGVRAWHLTLPVSSFVQWLVKLGVAALVVALLVVGLPLAMAALAEAVMRTGWMPHIPTSPLFYLSATGLLVVSFWTVTLVGHTVKAAVATVMVLAALALCAGASVWFAQYLALGTDLLTWLMVEHQLPPSAFLPMGRSLRPVEGLAPIVSMGALSLLALRQSLLAFRAVQIDNRRVVRFAAQLGALALVVSFVPAAYLRAAAEQHRSAPVRELEVALQHLSVASIAATGRPPDSVTPAQLEATGLLSAGTAKWIAGSHVSILPTTRRPSAGSPVGAQASTLGIARVRFPNGRDFGILYRLFPVQ